MKYTILLGVLLFSGAALAGEGWHNFSSSSENPHAQGGCASKKDKMAQFHKYHGKKWDQADADEKVDVKKEKAEPKLEEFI